MPQGQQQQEKLYGSGKLFIGTKVIKKSNPATSLWIAHREQVGCNGKMIAEFFAGTGELGNAEVFVGKDIVDAQCRGNTIESVANTGPFFCKGICQSLPDDTVGVTVRNIIEIAADNDRVRTFLNFGPDMIALFFSFAENGSEFGKYSF